MFPLLSVSIVEVKCPPVGLLHVFHGADALQSVSQIFNFAFSALTLLVGRQEGHAACKTLGVGSLEVMICHSSSCHHHLHHPCLQQDPDILVPVKPDPPGKMAVITENEDNEDVIDSLLWFSSS